MSTLHVATTVNPRFDHVTPIETTRSAVTISHRCHVIAELLAVARSGMADVVLLANDLEMVTLETLQQLADGDGYGPKVAAISDITEDRQRLTQLGIPVASPNWSGQQLVQWLQDTHQSTTNLEEPTALSTAELQFLHAVDPDHAPASVRESTEEQGREGRRSGRRAAPYDPTQDVPPSQQPETRDGEALVSPAAEELALAEPPTQLDTTQGLDSGFVIDNGVGEEPGEGAVASDEAAVDDTVSEDQPPLGHLIAVWGPIGSPGVTTTAVNLAVESTLAGYRTLLIDADTYGAAVAVHLGLLDDTAAIAQACRAAEHRGIDAASLADFTQRVTIEGSSMAVLTGLTRSERWPQLRAAAWTQVLHAARTGWDHIIVDCGFGLEEDEELSFDIPAPQRNATTLTAVSTADRIVAVGTGDPVGFVRFMKALDHLAEMTQTSIVPVINKVAAMTSGVGPKHQLTGVWERFGPSMDLQHFLPWAPDVVSSALLAGKTLAEAAPKSELRQAIRTVMRASASSAPPVVATTTHGTPTLSRFRRAVAGLKQSLTRKGS